MSEQFETLFENLAKGMSRRAALRRFFGGIAGAAAFALTGRRAAAAGGCGDWCQQTYGDRGPGWVAACVRASSDCPDGACASFSWFSWGDESGGSEQTPGGGPPTAHSHACVPAG
jgi:hypothetical protein